MLPRRKILQGLVHAGAAAFLPQSARVFAQREGLPTERLSTQRLRETVLMVRGAEANVLVLASQEGPILLDGGAAAWSPALLAHIAQFAPGQAIRALINTHWHPEQVGSNVALGERGTEIIAHDNTRLWLSTNVAQRWSGKHFSALPKAALPHTTLYDSAEKRIGEHTLRLAYLPEAHTDGDLCVYLPAANLLFAGGFLSNDTWPLIDWWTGGWSGGVLNAFAAVLPLCNAATLIVPSSGPLMTYADLQAQSDMYHSIFDKVHTAFVQSLSPEETVALQPASGYKPAWGSADLFITLAAQSLQGQLRGAVGGWLPRIP
ncbi:MAG: MBL fold metallo-hydrolase [Pseudomonadales bacterium]|jgi:glyoxylase-like metal-dependent hydrolase (beta-lactamase superfamily II)|nr:MBL fold metallo-hydrolase [Pseudomonadales bacterium]